MTDFFYRLEEFMNHYNLNDNRITVETGMANGLIGKARKRGSLSQVNISKILKAYPNLNARWLLTGEGDMLTSSNADNFEQIISVYTGIFTKQESKIEELNREIGRLQTKVEDMK